MRRVLWILLATHLAAADMPWHVDLDGDGRQEVISSYSAPGREMRWGIQVKDSRGRLIWKSPADMPDAGQSFIGVSDLDRDGRMDLVFHNYGRGGPGSFGCWPWTGRAFEWRRNQGLPIWSSGSLDRFDWKEGDYRSGTFAVIQELPGPGLATVTVSKGGGGDDFQSGTALLSYQGKGHFRTERWSCPIHRSVSSDYLRLPKATYTDITDSDLANHSGQELSLMRNELFARHGRPFQDPTLAEYFKKQKWYRADAHYRDSYLSQQELRNAQFIADYQQRHGKNW